MKSKIAALSASYRRPHKMPNLRSLTFAVFCIALGLLQSAASGQLAITAGVNDSNYNPLSESGVAGLTLRTVPCFPDFKSAFSQSTGTTANKSRYLEYEFTPGQGAVEYLAPGEYYIAAQLVAAPRKQLKLSMSVNGKEILPPTVYSSQKHLTGAIWACSQPFQYSGGKLKLKLQGHVITNGDCVSLGSLVIRQAELADLKKCVTLENNKVKFVFTRAGQLVEIHNKLSQCSYLSRKPLLSAPFALHYNKSAYDANNLSVLGHELSCSDQEKKLTFRYKLGQVSINSVVSLGDGCESNWVLEIRNNSKYVITGQTFPVIDNLSLADDSENEQLFWPSYAGVLIPDPQKNLGSSRIHYMGTASMSWCALYNKAGSGLYLGIHDKNLIDTDLDYESRINRTSSISFTKSARIEPGSVHQMAPAVVAAYTGDWHWAADRYGAWARTWITQPRVPAWIQNTFGFKHELIQWQKEGPWKPANECAITRKFDQVHAVFEDAASTGYTDVWLGGQMVRGNCYRYYALDPYLGSEDQFRSANDEIKAKGGHILYYTNGMNWDAAFPGNLPQKYKGKVPTAIPVVNGWNHFNELNCLRQADGTVQVQYPGQGNWNFRIMCPYAAGWQQYLKYWIVDKYLKEYNVSGMQVDQVGCTYWGNCYSQMHGHKHPGSTVQGYVALMKMLDESGSSADPDFATFTEGLCDAVGQYATLQGLPGNYFDSPFYYPDVYRYIFPEQILRAYPNELGSASNRDFDYMFLQGIRIDKRWDGKFPHRIANILNRIYEIYFASKFKSSVALGTLPGQVVATLFEYNDGQAYVVAVSDGRQKRGAYDLQLNAGALPGLARTAHAYCYPGHLSDGRQVLSLKHSPSNLVVHVPEMPDINDASVMAVLLSGKELPELNIVVPSIITLDEPFKLVVQSRNKNISGVSVKIGAQSLLTDDKGAVSCVLNKYSGSYLVWAQKQGYMAKRTFIKVKSR